MGLKFHKHYKIQLAFDGWKLQQPKQRTIQINKKWYSQILVIDVKEIWSLLSIDNIYSTTSHLFSALNISGTIKPNFTNLKFKIRFHKFW